MGLTLMVIHLDGNLALGKKRKKDAKQEARLPSFLLTL